MTSKEPMEIGEDKFPPLHPGEVLIEEYLKPMGISQNRLALSMRVPARRINEIVLGKRAITADTALRLSLAIGTTPEFWLGLQTQYDLDIAKVEKLEQLKQDVKPIQG
jgi:addiction module HigA family antidote